jgi:hypothetical protein
VASANGGARGKTLANEGRFADVGAVLGRDVRLGTSARGRGTREVGGDRAGYGPWHERAVFLPVLGFGSWAARPWACLEERGESRGSPRWFWVGPRFGGCMRKGGAMALVPQPCEEEKRER